MKTSSLFVLLCSAALALAAPTPADEAPDALLPPRQCCCCNLATKKVECHAVPSGSCYCLAVVCPVESK